MRYVNFMSSTAYKIEFYHLNTKLHDIFNDVFIVSDADTSKEEIRRLIDLKVGICKQFIKDELPYLNEHNITYKVFRTKYYLGQDNFIEIVNL